MTGKMAVFLAAVALAVAAALGSLRPMVIEGSSGAPTLLWGDLVLANALAYDLRLPFAAVSLGKWRDPGRGDLVLFEVPGSAGPTLTFRRVIGLPGETVEIRDNVVYVEGTPLRQRPAELDRSRISLVNHLGGSIAAETSNGGSHLIAFSRREGQVTRFGPVSVRPGAYFVLADNRDFSNDSRHFGPVPRERVRGKLLAVLKRNDLSPAAARGSP